jgi:hypothetical protein
MDANRGKYFIKYRTIGQWHYYHIVGEYRRQQMEEWGPRYFVMLNDMISYVHESDVHEGAFILTLWRHISQENFYVSESRSVGKLSRFAYGKRNKVVQRTNRLEMLLFVCFGRGEISRILHGKLDRLWTENKTCSKDSESVWLHDSLMIWKVFDFETLINLTTQMLISFPTSYGLTKKGGKKYIPYWYKSIMPGGMVRAVELLNVCFFFASP